MEGWEKTEMYREIERWDCLQILCADDVFYVTRRKLDGNPLVDMPDLSRQILACGTCTWHWNMTGAALTIQGPQDCGSTCTNTSLDLRDRGIISISDGTFNRTGLSHVTELRLDSNQISSSVTAETFAGLTGLQYL